MSFNPEQPELIEYDSGPEIDLGHLAIFGMDLSRSGLFVDPGLLFTPESLADYE